MTTQIQTRSALLEHDKLEKHSFQSGAYADLTEHHTTYLEFRMRQNAPTGADDAPTRWPLLIPEVFATAESVTHHSSGGETIKSQNHRKL